MGAWNTFFLPLPHQPCETDDTMALLRAALLVATPMEPGIHGEMLGPGQRRGAEGMAQDTPGEARSDAIIIEVQSHERLDGMRLASYKTIHAFSSV
jgi:hypothetical protein